MKTIARARQNPGGRPPKFDEPSRPITVTLPESTLRKLGLIDPDRGQAIVKLARASLGEEKGTAPLVELVDLAGGSGLVVVGFSQVLRQIPFLHLIEVGPGRFLLALKQGSDFKSLELALLDALNDLPDEENVERVSINQLIDLIRKVRRSFLGKTAEVLLVDNFRDINE